MNVIALVKADAGEPPNLPAFVARLARGTVPRLDSLICPPPREFEVTFDAFTARRYDRVKTVVEESVQLGQWMLDGVEGNVPALMGKVMGLVSQPA